MSSAALTTKANNDFNGSRKRLQQARLLFSQTLLSVERVMRPAAASAQRVIAPAVTAATASATASATTIMKPASDAAEALKTQTKAVAARASKAMEPALNAVRPYAAEAKKQLEPVAKALEPVAAQALAATSTALTVGKKIAKDHLPDMATLRRIFNMKDFYKVEDDLGYVQSEAMAALSLFAFSQKEAKVFLQGLEATDTRFTQMVHVKDFARMYCPQYVDTFVYLWRSFHALYRTAQKGAGGERDALIREEKDKAAAAAAGTANNGTTAATEAAAAGNGDDETSRARPADAPVDVDKRSPSYTQFIAYLLFFMAVPDADLQKFLYWMWYYQPRRRVKVENLMAHFESVWGDVGDGNEVAAEYASRRKRLETSLGLAVMKEFNYRVFQITDWKAGGAWTTPLRNMRKQLAASFGGEEFWRHVTPLVAAVGADVRAAIDRLEDAPLPIPRCLVDCKVALAEAHAAGAEDVGGGTVWGDVEGASQVGGAGVAGGSLGAGSTIASPSPAKGSQTKRAKELAAMQQQLDKHWKNAGVRVDGRKRARKELRLFLRVSRTLNEMPVENFGGDFSEDTGVSQLLKVLYRGAKQVASTMKEFLSELRMAMRHDDNGDRMDGDDDDDNDDESDDEELQAFLDEVTIEGEGEPDDVVSVSPSQATPGLVGVRVAVEADCAVDDADASVAMPVDPEVKYKAALKVPVGMLHHMAGTARSRVSAMMLDLDDMAAAAAVAQVPAIKDTSEVGGSAKGSDTGSAMNKRPASEVLSIGSRSKESQERSQALYSRSSGEASERIDIADDPVDNDDDGDVEVAASEKKKQKKRKA